ncbi:MAG: DUF262 domain-containing protein [Aestuariivita sp.]|nr:DUF262 domain-containing protein [Aestuariivita sp.]MCY4346356.1 DUF262 domain-containing protein [Aestuariivita sp.]
MTLESEPDILDDAEDEQSIQTSFSITSFGTDYPVEIIAPRIRSSDWYAPLFRRNFVWSLNQASRFIESLLLGLPVPGIFLFKEIKTGKHLIIDGQQRTKSLQLYLDEDRFANKKFRLTNVSNPYNGKAFSELDLADQRRLKDSILHATIFRQKSPEGDNSSIYEVFERINTGGSKLPAQEIRACINHGPAVEFLEKMASKEVWRSVFGSSSKWLKDQELILRFFAFIDREANYSNPMKKFLDEYMSSLHTKNNFRNLERQFDETFGFFHESGIAKPFRPERALVAAVFDAVSVQTSRLISASTLPRDYVDRCRKLLTDTHFLNLCSSATADPERVRSRFATAKSFLQKQ